jgi:hypothetical protein
MAQEKKYKFRVKRAPSSMVISLDGEHQGSVNKQYKLGDLIEHNMIQYICIGKGSTNPEDIEDFTGAKILKEAQHDLVLKMYDEFCSKNDPVPSSDPDVWRGIVLSKEDMNIGTNIDIVRHWQYSTLVKCILNFNEEDGTGIKIDLNISKDILHTFIHMDLENDEKVIGKEFYVLGFPVYNKGGFLQIRVNGIVSIPDGWSPESEEEDSEENKEKSEENKEKKEKESKKKGKKDKAKDKEE